MIFMVINLVQVRFDIVNDLSRFAVARFRSFPWLLGP